MISIMTTSYALDTNSKPLRILHKTAALFHEGIIRSFTIHPAVSRQGPWGMRRMAEKAMGSACHSACPVQSTALL